MNGAASAGTSSGVIAISKPSFPGVVSTAGGTSMPIPDIGIREANEFCTIISRIIAAWRASTDTILPASVRLASCVRNRPAPL